MKDNDTLEQLIAKALELHAERLEIEYKDGREEICAMRGNIGVGIASLESSSDEALALRERLDKIRKKPANVRVQGETYRLKVRIYSSFGEEAYRIDWGSPNR